MDQAKLNSTLSELSKLVEDILNDKVRTVDIPPRMETIATKSPFNPDNMTIVKSTVNASGIQVTTEKKAPVRKKDASFFSGDGCSIF